ncbi:MAG TPA: biotin synthase, partial [Flavobacteriales bacterium]|nr:biotin synthase [Flavobacteriales bacterium]
MNENRPQVSKEEILDIYQKPLLELVFEAATIHRQFNVGSEVQVSSLISIKTGGCSEDCGYCPQAARYSTGLEAHKLMSVEQVTEYA